MPIKQRSPMMLLALAVPLAACDRDPNVTQADIATTGEPLPVATDATHITLGGEVVSATPAAFVLDYGPDTVTVEMDDWDWYQEGRAIKPGDRVTVSGVIDNDLTGIKSIEASTVYVANLGSIFYASAADEEDVLPRTPMVLHPRNVDLTGRVSNVSGREFMLGSEDVRLRVDTSAMRDNPLDDEGPLQVDVGDRVYVWGSLGLAGAESELLADGIISFTPDPRRGQGAASSLPGNSSAVATGNSL